MIKITKEGIIIQIPGEAFTAEDIEILQDVVIEALHLATSSKCKSTTF